MVTSEYVNWIRRAELETVIPLLPPSAKVLEIGGGTGEQALQLSRLGFDVTAIDLPSSNYSTARVFPIIEYDGQRIPFPDGTFDVVFSSNTLEHVRDLKRMHAEIRRVLAPTGFCLHIVPTGAWQFWSIISAFPSAGRELIQARSLRDVYLGLRHLARAAIPPRHGERGFGLLEIWLFRPAWWRRNFRKNNFVVEADAPVGLFYTGNGFFGSSWPISKRRRLAPRLGSACHIFKLRPQPGQQAPK
ncbi:MAG: class I SAM-dependent methyltransferase [Pseudomonadota bacterium]|nr:class I SAM-dependent methyltransferase [Pseudomonadota bacterium]